MNGSNLKDQQARQGLNSWHKDRHIIYIALRPTLKKYIRLITNIPIHMMITQIPALTGFLSIMEWVTAD